MATVGCPTCVTSIGFARRSFDCGTENRPSKDAEKNHLNGEWAITPITTTGAMVNGESTEQ